MIFQNFNSATFPVFPAFEKKVVKFSEKYLDALT